MCSYSDLSEIMFKIQCREEEEGGVYRTLGCFYFYAQYFEHEAANKSHQL